MAQAGPSSGTASTCTGVDRCNSQGCICCEHIMKGADKFHSTATGEQYNITQHLTCRTPSVIYIIQCKKCLKQYVGKTSTTLQRRFKDHRSSIRKRQHRPIPDHFNSEDHCLDHLILYPIERVNCSEALNERELYWIRELDTINHGLNLVPYKCVRQEQLGDGEERSEGPADRQVEESKKCPQKGKRKLCGKDDLKSKRKKLNYKGQTVFSYETEELLLKCEDALEDGKQIISDVYDKMTDVSYREEDSGKFLEELRKKISDLKERDQKKKIYIGLFGRTGEGKSSLINAIVNEDQILPSGDMDACTSVFVHVQANTDSSKYKADIEFISPEDWKTELQFLVELLEKENEQKTAEDDEMVEMAREIITAIYGEEGLEKSYSELVGPREFPEIPRTGKRTMNFDKAEELSQSIQCYIWSNIEAKQHFWPLVKRVTISLPNSPALLERIVLVDLPGAGDVSKYRNEMWKECLSQCSSVWIVSEMKRALADKVGNEIFDESLRHVAGGGECHNITFIVTKTDIIKPAEIKKNYHITDEYLEIEGDTEDEYKRRERQACILFRNGKCKEKIRGLWKEKTKKFLLGDEGHSDGFFDVYTVSSEKFSELAQKNSPVKDRNETELPLLMEHIKKLYVSHSVKEVKDYVSEVSGIISFLHCSQDALSAKAQTSNSQEFRRFEKDLEKFCTTLNSALDKVHSDLKKRLLTGAKEAEKHCLTNATKKVLEKERDNRGYHKTLKALCRNDGYCRSGNGVVVDLNYTLSEPMYKEMNDVFLTMFGTRGSRKSIIAHFESFQKDFIKDELLKYYATKNKEKYLRLVYIRTEQRKLHNNLEKEILKRKKQIYNSLTDSIRDTMMETYKECAGIHGQFSFSKIQENLKDAIEKSKNDMFCVAMKRMLWQVSATPPACQQTHLRQADAQTTPTPPQMPKGFRSLQKYLVEETETQMTTSLRLALKQIPKDLTGLPDVSEEMETMKRSCDSLGLKIFEVTESG